MSIPRFKVRPEIRRARHISECSTSSDVPLQFTNSAYTGDVDNVSRSSTDSQEMTVPTSLESSLQRDGLCQNTYENISIAGNLDSFEEKCDTTKTAKGVRMPSQCRTVLFFMLVLMSAFSLVLSLMMFLDTQMNSRCSCYSMKEGEFSRQAGNGTGGSSGNPELSEKILYKMLLANMTKLEDQLRDLNKFKDNNDEHCQKLVKKNEILENRINELENTTSQVDVRMQILETRLNQSTNETNDISNDVDTKMNAIKTKLSNSTETLKTTASNLKQDMQTKINDVKKFFWTTLNSSVDKVKKEFGDYYKQMNYTMGKAIKVVMMNLNDTERELDATNSTLHYEMQTLRSDVLNKIQNISKMEGPRGPQGPQGPPGVQGQQGLRGPPGFNGTSTNSPGMASRAANFSLCQYKSKKSDFSTGGLGLSGKTDASKVESMDQRIVGAVCSGNDLTKEYHFKRSVVSGKNKYICSCIGVSDKTGTMSCILNYWECPIVT